MKIKSSIGRIQQTETLAFMIREIVRIADPEKILLLSASYDYRLTENIFLKSPVEEFRGSRYNLLILSGGREKKSPEKQDIKIITRLHDIRKLQFQLMDIHDFNKKVEAGDEFENFILLNAILCYDKGHIQLSDPEERSLKQY